MDISFSNICNNTITAKFTGEIDESNADYMKTKLDEIIDNNIVNNIILDFISLEFLDSTAIGVLLGRYKKTKRNNMQIYIKNPTKHVDFILNTCGIYTIIQKLN